MKVNRLLFACVAVLLSVFARAETLVGRVVGLADGDTVTVLDSQQVQHRVRIAGIDAPEKRQPYSARSKLSLSALVMGREVAVDWRKVDRYGRLVGTVRLDGVDAGLEQVRIGLAWHYKAYEGEQSPADRMLYAATEDTARRAKLGLWSQSSPEPPWDFRRASRSR